MQRASLALALALLPAVAHAQGRDISRGRQALPRDVVREATSLYNDTSTHRTVGPFDVAAGREIRGDVAVLNGPLTIAGHITGRVLAINADVLLKPSARIEGDLLVVGGDVEGRNDAYVGGEIRIYRQPLRYTQSDDRIEADQDTMPEADNWWRRWERRRSRNWSKLQIASAGAYNRVEGLPINLGPQVQHVTPWGSVRLDAYGVIRTSGSFGTDKNDIGHNVRAEVQLGQRNGLALGGRVFNVVDGVEDWQLSDLETGLSSFLLHRDYRDWYERHGTSAYATGFVRHGLSLTGTYGLERWTSREVHDPFTLFRNEAPWRLNPAVDEGLMHVGDVRLKFDSRNDPDHPASGWYLVADWERGTGTLTAPRFPGVLYVPGQPAPRRVDYSRAFLDMRRYNRLSPDAHLDFRVVLGGWAGGDALPLERRLSVDGPGSMPGFGFRAPGRGVDVATCNATLVLPGTPASCERIVLVQTEYRGDIHFGFGDDDSNAHFRHLGAMSFQSGGTWVLFLDAGRGWLVNAPADPSMTYASDRLPPLSTFRTDAGIGLDFGIVGVYVAKALSAAGEPARIFVRLHHRF